MYSIEELRQRLLSNKKSQTPKSAVDATLIVVDMQTLFPASQLATTMKNVEELLRIAIGKNWGIVLLEHAGYGATDKRLLEILATQVPGIFDRCAIRTKEIWDGSIPVARALVELNLPSKKFYVCGVNTFECVQDTVVGLGQEFSQAQINLVQSACNCETNNPWDSFPVNGNGNGSGSGNLRLIPTLSSHALLT